MDGQHVSLTRLPFVCEPVNETEIMTAKIPPPNDAPVASSSAWLQDPGNPFLVNSLPLPPQGMSSSSLSLAVETEAQVHIPPRLLIVSTSWWPEPAQIPSAPHRSPANPPTTLPLQQKNLQAAYRASDGPAILPGPGPLTTHPPQPASPRLERARSLAETLRWTLAVPDCNVDEAIGLCDMLRSNLEALRHSTQTPQVHLGQPSLPPALANPTPRPVENENIRTNPLHMPVSPQDAVPSTTCLIRISTIRSLTTISNFSPA
jgi:hypothetical protein